MPGSAVRDRAGMVVLGRVQAEHAALLAALGHVPMLIYPRLRARRHPDLLRAADAT